MSELLLKKYAELYGRLDALKALDRSSPAGAYLLSGEDSDGLALFARLVAAKLSGLSAERALSDNADIAVYPQGSPEKSKSKKEAKRPIMAVDDVKQLIGSLYLTPFELDRRFYIIEYAETMSEICQNKLLKSLEEPPARVTFILCATRALLPTVQSRCVELLLPPFPFDTVKAALAANHRGDVELAARACRGNIGMAERMLADRDFNDTYACALDIIKLANGSKMFAKAAAVYDKFTREKADGVLGLMEYLLADIARSLSGLDTVFDRADVVAASVGFTPYSAARCADFVRDAKKRNDGNGMIAALLDELVLKIMEEKALCKR